MHLNQHMDPQLVDNIANEVKSQGVFDQFRRDSMADVDTKPAYQNLRQRVENTVKKFLSEQKWTPELNKNQLREKLRRHINDAGFLDVGVERIVDQVVNPKIASVFQPKIEDIAYKYLNIPKPIPKPMPQLAAVGQTAPLPQNGVLQIETDLLPTDLEQVSPDSDKTTEKTQSRENLAIDVEEEDKIDDDDDDESPPFEPLEGCLPSPQKEEIQKVIDNSSMHNLTDISVDEDSKKSISPEQNNFKYSESSSLAITNAVEQKLVESETKDTLPKVDNQENEIYNTMDATQQSQLSQVSSNSRLSIVTHENSEGGDDEASRSRTVNISEEAQMPKFSENSNGTHSKDIANSDISSGDTKAIPLHFDIMKDEIKFEGTERKTEISNASSDSPTTNSDRPSHGENVSAKMFPDNSNGSGFNFSNINFTTGETADNNAKKRSSIDSVERELSCFEKSENSQCSLSQSQSKSDLKSAEENLKKIDSDIVENANILTISNGNQVESNRDKDESTRFSSSSSLRHKKHHKERRSEKDRKKDRDREKEKNEESISNRKQSNTCSNTSSVSRYSNTVSHKTHSTSGLSVTTQRSSSDPNTKRSSSQQHKSRHHSRSDKHHSRSRDSKKDKSSSKSGSSKHKSSSNPLLSPNKNDEKQSEKSVVDDHYASKSRIQSRKSTDSNDDESSQDRSIVSRNIQKSVNSNQTAISQQSNTKPINTSSTTEGKMSGSVQDNVYTTRTRTTAKDSQRPKVIILDRLLDNPATNFIEFTDEVQICTNKSDDIDSKPLYYFEDNNNDQFKLRLKIINEAIANFRKLIEFTVPTFTHLQDNESMNSTDAEYSASPSSSRGKQQSASPQFLGHSQKSSDQTNLLTSATLHIDCIQYGGNGVDEAFKAKRFKFDSPITKVSPTPSELSVNSKENEFVDRNYSLLDGPIEATEACSKLSQSKQNKASQRYSSEDLYKPRPILSQRSKRRRLDAVI